MAAALWGSGYLHGPFLEAALEEESGLAGVLKLERWNSSLAGLWSGAERARRAGCDPQEIRRWSAERLRRAKQNPHAHTFPHAQANKEANGEGDKRAEWRRYFIQWKMKTIAANERVPGRFSQPHLKEKKEVGFLSSLVFVLGRNTALKSSSVAKKSLPVSALSCPTSSSLGGLAVTCPRPLRNGHRERREKGGDSSDIAQQTEVSRALKLQLPRERWLVFKV